jgi:hypothetical protein
MVEFQSIVGMGRIIDMGRITFFLCNMGFSHVAWEIPILHGKVTRTSEFPMPCHQSREKSSREKFLTIFLSSRGKKVLFAGYPRYSADASGDEWRDLLSADTETNRLGARDLRFVRSHL